MKQEGKYLHEVDLSHFDAALPGIFQEKFGYLGFSFYIFYSRSHYLENIHR